MMEVQRVNQTSISKVDIKESIPKDSVSFNSVIEQKRAQQSINTLNQKMQEIDAYGNKLVESRTVENLRKYKKLVKDFLQDTVKNGLDLQNQRGFSQRGSAKVYKLVKEVDKKLVNLTNSVLDKEQKGLDILGVVGEIKGLLINIYT